MSNLAQTLHEACTLHAKFQLPMLPEEALNFCGGIQISAYFHFQLLLLSLLPWAAQTATTKNPSGWVKI